MLETVLEFPTVSTAIHEAVAPVFLLTGIGSILGVLTNRLGRAVDRARRLVEMTVEQRERYLDEVAIIGKRIYWIRLAISLITFSALSICMSIASLFIVVEMKMDSSAIVSFLFISAMSTLIFGLLCFLREIVLASKEIIAPTRFEKT